MNIYGITKFSKDSEERRERHDILGGCLFKNKATAERYLMHNYACVKQNGRYVSENAVYEIFEYELFDFMIAEEES